MRKAFFPRITLRKRLFQKSKRLMAKPCSTAIKSGIARVLPARCVAETSVWVKQGKYIGTVTEGPEYESCAMLGSNLGVESFGAVLKANQLCDEFGIDTIFDTVI